MAQPLPQKYPATEKLKLYRGNYRPILLTFTEDDGTPKDLTGYEFLSQIRATKDGAVMATFTCTCTTPTTGIVLLELPDTEAADLVPGDAFWDFQWTDGDDHTFTPLANAVSIIGDTTRPVAP